MSWRCVWLIAAFFVFVVTGCQTENKSAAIKSSMTEICVSKSKTFGKMNENYFAAYREKDKLAVFKHALDTAQKEKRQQQKMDYDLLIKEGDGYYLVQLYLGKDGESSAFMYIGHEDSTYVTTKEATEELRNILKE